MVFFGFVFPGAKEKIVMKLKFLQPFWGTKSSRLTKKLVDDLQLVTDF